MLLKVNKTFLILQEIVEFLKKYDGTLSTWFGKI